MGERPIMKKVKHELSLLEKVSLAIPGFHGYKQKELRREADRIIRDHLYRMLCESKSQMRNIFQTLVLNEQRDFLGETDRLIAKFDRIAEMINHAPYGYSGFFDAVKIEEDDLDAMLNFDAQMIEKVGGLRTEVNNFMKELRAKKFENTESKLSQIRNLLEDLESTFNERKEFIMGIKF